MIKHRFTIEARVDLYSAVEFYNSRREGLGYELAVEVGLALAKILAAPKSWPEIEPGFRRYRLDRFPYGIIYRIMNPFLVEIVAVFNLRAEPGSWRGYLR